MNVFISYRWYDDTNGLDGFGSCVMKSVETITTGTTEEWRNIVLETTEYDNIIILFFHKLDE